MSGARRWLGLGALLVGALAIAPGSAAASTGTRQPARRPHGTTTASTLDWHACARRFRCASLAVPIDYAKPSSGSLELAVVELPSTGAEPVGDLVMNPGGPGGSGVQFLEQTPFPAALRKSFNLVSFDPRGVGGSDPVRCVGAAGIRHLIALDPAPSTPAEVSEVVSATRSFVAQCVAHTSKLLLHNVGTRQTVEDLDRLRAALGQQELDYMGFSYGTYLGELYAQRYPTHVRAMVLDGVVDPALSTTASDLEQAEGFETDLRDFFTWCPSNSSCAHELTGGAKAAYDQLFAGLAGGRQLTADLQARYGGVQQVTLGVAEVALAGSLYSKQSWSYLAQAIQQGLLGNGAPLAAIAYSYEGLQQNGQFDNELSAETAIGCVDRPSPTRLSTYEQLSDEMAKAAPDFGASEAWGTLACAYWPVAAEGPPRAISAPGAPPILLVGSTDDPATPYRWAQAVSHQLAHAELLTRTGPGHTGYFFSTCVQRWVDSYLTTLSLPPKATDCPTDA